RSMLPVGQLRMADILELVIPDQECSSEGATRVPGGGLDPNVLEWPFPPYATIGHTIQSDTSRHDQVTAAVKAMGISRRAQHNLLGDGLNRCRKVHLLLGDHALRLTRRASKKHVELVRRHGQTLAIVEIRHVQSDRAV